MGLNVVSEISCLVTINSGFMHAVSHTCTCSVQEGARLHVLACTCVHVHFYIK